MKRSILAVVLCLIAWTAHGRPVRTPQAARDSVSVALDWTPNTNHTGIYVAEKLGYYAAAGIDVKILPYASTAPETLVSHRKADFGFSYSAGVAFARAAGEDVTSVFAVLQHTALEIGVRADRRDIRTPKDLDGKTYAGFGTPDEKPLLQTVIRNAGGTGDVQGRDAQHVRLRRRLPRQGRLHAAARHLGGHPGAARGQAAEDVQALAFGVPSEYSSLIASSDRLPEGQPGTRAALPGRDDARLPVRRLDTRAPRRAS